MTSNMEQESRGSSSAPQGQGEMSLEFITFADPEKARTIDNRRRVRSQAMRHVHRRSTPRVRTNDIELDITPLLQASRRGPGTLQTHQAKLSNQEASQGLFTILDATRLGPFFQYPIPMGNRERQLYDHRVYDETCVMFRTMRDVGFLNRVRQTAAFCQLLAMSSWHAGHMVPNSGQMTEHLRYSLVATRELQNEINHPAEHITDDTIAGTLAFVCCANLFHDSESWNVHIHGLRQMLDHRGGVHTLESNPVLRIVLYWADINGAYFQDVAPLFPAPEHLLPRSRRPNQRSIPEMGHSESSIEEKISAVCMDLREVQELIRDEKRQRNFWRDTIFPGLHLSPILGDLLKMRQEQSETGSINMTVEAFRLAAILYTCYLRELFGIDTLSGRPLYSSKLRACIPSLQPGNPPLNLTVWILCVAYTSGFSEQNKWFGERLQAILSAHSISNFDDLKALLVLLVWDEDILFTQSQYLRTLFRSNEQQGPEDFHTRIVECFDHSP